MSLPSCVRSKRRWGSSKPTRPQGHHAKYLDTINTALSTLRANPETKHLAKMGLDKLLQVCNKFASFEA